MLKTIMLKTVREYNGSALIKKDENTGEFFACVNDFNLAVEEISDYRSGLVLYRGEGICIISDMDFSLIFIQDQTDPSHRWKSFYMVDNDVDFSSDLEDD